MAYTQADIDTLKSHVASGILSVAFSDRTVTYKSTDDMLKALALMEAEVNADSTTPRPRVYYGATNKGV